MNRIAVFFVSIILSGCAASSSHLDKDDWVDMESWDSNANATIEKTEFVTGYLRSNFFRRWSKKSEFISYGEFLDSAFHFLDKTNDRALDSLEVNTVEYRYFQNQSTLSRWVLGANQKINREDFFKQVLKSDLITRVDLSGDKRISPSELAEWMFMACDSNRDNKAGGLEFYLWEVHRR